MPGRKIPLVNNEIYHVINRGVASQPIFLNKRDYDRALNTILYYQNFNIPLRYSFFMRLPQQRKFELHNQLKGQKEYFVDIVSYCLMPNHIHLLLKQKTDSGISIFMSKFSNSYTRYFNTKNDRIGHLFQGKFKSVRIENDEQLLHVSRYIHLNPFTSYVVKNLDELERYPYSSFVEYINRKVQSFCKKSLVLNHFRSCINYKEFVFNQADYQRKLDRIKHLILEK